VLSCVGRGFASGRSPVQGVLPIVYRFTSKNPSTPQGKRRRLRKKERLLKADIVDMKLELSLAECWELHAGGYYFQCFHKDHVSDTKPSDRRDM
jgi:hypothetical protein